MAINREVFPGKADRRGQYGKWSSEGVPVRQRTGNGGRTCGKACRSPKSDPWESGRPVKELCWRCSQVTREGFAELSSAKKGVAGASRLVQVEFLTLDKVTFSKSEYDSFCHSGEVRSILRRVSERPGSRSGIQLRKR